MRGSGGRGAVDGRSLASTHISHSGREVWFSNLLQRCHSLWITLHSDSHKVLFLSLWDILTVLTFCLSQHVLFLSYSIWYHSHMMSGWVVVSPVWSSHSLLSKTLRFSMIQELFTHQLCNDAINHHACARQEILFPLSFQLNFLSLHSVSWVCTAVLQATVPVPV